MVQPLTLIEYAPTRQLDPAQLLTEFAANPDALPEPVGIRAGQPTYDPNTLDRARGITTLAGFAALRERDLDDVRRWYKRHSDLWPEPVGAVHTGGVGNPAILYPLGALDLVAAAESARRGPVEHSEDLITADEYAAEKGLSPNTVKTGWRNKHRDVWPAPAGRRGRQHLFERAGLERVYRVARGLPEPVGSPEDLLTRAQVMEYLGLSEEQQWWREYRGHWPAGERVERDGVVVEVWSRGRVEELHAGLMPGTPARG